MDSHEYQNIIQEITAIERKKCKQEFIIALAYLFALEFSQTLRACSEQYGETANFQEFIEWELETNNLIYDDYNKTADHYIFLEHFIGKNNLQEIVKKIEKTTIYNNYIQYIQILTTEEKLATIVSREKELHGIFQKIVNAHNRQQKYWFYKYFLQRHIELDSEEEWHKDLTKNLIDISQHTNMLKKIRDKRNKLYKIIQNY